ncbi:MAG: hypothetical protein K1060chlam5_00998 [Candidatus Anoxychlamydiales bacterium]|nr:hypothetical protein [Candidatus Anoxychlamydiales bacterium]
MDEKEKPSKTLIRYGMYCNFIKEIKHFDIMQTFFRLISSTILLSSIAAIGFIYSFKTFSFPFQRTAATLMISIIGISTLITIWFVDLKFYEKILVSNFAEAFRMEKDFDFLPKVHHNMLFSVHKKDHPSNVAFYYIGCINTIILTIGCIMSYDFYSVHKIPIVSITILVIMLTLLFLISFIIKKKTNKISDLMKKINYLE